MNDEPATALEVEELRAAVDRLRAVNEELRQRQLDEDRPEVIELKAQIDGLRRSLVAANDQPLRPLFRPVNFADSIPGWIEQFNVQVPDSHVVDGGVSCTCGKTVTVAPGDMAGCDCGRYFLHLDGRILVARAGAA